MLIHFDLFVCSFERERKGRREGGQEEERDRERGTGRERERKTETDRQTNREKGRKRKGRGSGKGIVREEGREKEKGGGKKKKEGKRINQFSLIPFVTMVIICWDLLYVYFASKLQPVCKELPGLPSTPGVGFDRG